MLTSERRRRLAPLGRLGPAPATAGVIDWTTPIDHSRSFLCETVTPLYYTSVYRDLGEEHRRRYNQLTGMLSNELILLLETEFLTASLSAVEHAADADLRAAVVQFAEDEHRHADTWRRLNLLSEPVWYGANEHVLCRPSPAIRRICRAIARHPLAWPVVFWVQLSQEERSLDISRRCLRAPADRMEPHYAAAYREHLRDEVRHVQIDCHLIERYYATRSKAVRQITAALFRAIVGPVFLRPLGSTVRVVRALVAEYPELAPLLPRILEELRGLTADEGYQRMMYSRETTPITFEWLDRFEEFRSMGRVLSAYVPPMSGRS